MELANIAENKKVCHDCQKEILINGELIENGVYLSYDNAGKIINIFKCNECFAKNTALANFQECEVYSRVVGYLRPVQQWHQGKKQEYQERKEFLTPGENTGCC
jgi:ribonucleoside-triphosphate reductase